MDVNLNCRSTKNNNLAYNCAEENTNQSYEYSCMTSYIVKSCWLENIFQKKWFKLQFHLRTKQTSPSRPSQPFNGVDNNWRLGSVGRCVVNLAYQSFIIGTYCCCVQCKFWDRALYWTILYSLAYKFTLVGIFFVCRYSMAVAHHRCHKTDSLVLQVYKKITVFKSTMNVHLIWNCSTVNIVHFTQYALKKMVDFAWTYTFSSGLPPTAQSL